MVKVYDMASGDLLSDFTLATQRAGGIEAGWSAPGVHAQVAEATALPTDRYRDVPELALQLLVAR